MIIATHRDSGLRYLKTSRYCIALKSRRFDHPDRPGSTVIPLPFGHRLTIRRRDTC